jgi:hypothetical protein
MIHRASGCFPGGYISVSYCVSFSRSKSSWQTKGEYKLLRTRELFGRWKGGEMKGEEVMMTTGPPAVPLKSTL